MPCDDKRKKMAEDELPDDGKMPVGDDMPRDKPDAKDGGEELDMEIFAAGKWNGKTWTEKELDEMVAAFAETRDKLKPYLKLGHDDKQKLLQKDGLPAAGWVTDIKRAGDKIVAHIKGVPGKIAELIRRKAYGRVSSEIYMGVDIEGKKYARCLKAVALLGGDTPAVTSLDDFINLYGHGALAVEYAADVEAETVTYERDSNMDNLEVYTSRIAELEGQLAEFTKRVSDVETERDELKAKVEQFTAEAAERETAMFTAEVKACVDGALTAGKITPIEADFYTKIASVSREQYEIVREHLGKRGKAEFAAETVAEQVDAKDENDDDKLARVANEVVAEHAKSGKVVTYKQALIIASAKIKGE